MWDEVTAIKWFCGFWVLGFGWGLFGFWCAKLFALPARAFEEASR